MMMTLPYPPPTLFSNLIMANQENLDMIKLSFCVPLHKCVLILGIIEIILAIGGICLNGGSFLYFLASCQNYEQDAHCAHLSQLELEFTSRNSAFLLIYTCSHLFTSIILVNAAKQRSHEKSRICFIINVILWFIGFGYFTCNLQHNMFLIHCATIILVGKFISICILKSFMDQLHKEGLDS